MERRNLIRAYGAEIVLSEGAKGMSGAIAKAKELAERSPTALLWDSLKIRQILRRTIRRQGRKYGQDTDGAMRCICRRRRYRRYSHGSREIFKGKNGVDYGDRRRAGGLPPVLSTGVGGKHGIQGIGAGFVPAILNTEHL